MDTSTNPKKKNGYNRLLVCLLFVAVVMLLSAGTGYCETGIQALNASGNRNIALSVDPIAKDEGYSAVLYNNKNGLPTSEANAIAQTSEGFIWIGSYAGLIRYDGNDFERYDPDAGIANVRSLYVDSMDRLWVGTNDSGIFLLVKGELFHWGKADGLESVSIRSITEGEDGLFYIAGTAGVGFIDEALQYHPVEDEHIAGQTVFEIRQGSDGLVYGLTNTSNLFTLKDGKLISWFSSSEYAFGNAVSILPDPEHPGFLYVGTEYYVCHGRLGEGFDTWEIRDASPLVTVQNLEFVEGRIWICSRTGLGRLEDDGVHPIRNIPMNNFFVHIMTDSDGNLWVVSSRQGVMKIVSNMFTDLFEQLNLPAEVVNSTCLLDDQLFIGTENSLIVIQDGEKVSGLPLTKAVTSAGEPIDTSDLVEYLNGVRIRAINRDSKNRLWISTASDHGLIRYDRGEITQFTREDGLVSQAVRVVNECQDGSILVATNDGFNIIEGDRVVKSYGQEEGIAVRLTLTILEGFNHEIIAGSDGGGIYIIQPDGIRRLSSDDGLKSEVVLRIRRSHTRDLYWIVTGTSLACMTPDYQIKNLHDFPYDNLYDLYENSKGDLWLLGSTGIYMIDADALTADEPIDPIFLGFSSGLQYVATANSYSELTEDGDLYISGNEGIIKVNIDNPPENKGEIKVTVPYVDCDGERLYPDNNGVFSVPGTTRKLIVYPYVFNYSLLDPQVSWRLEGFDEEYSSAKRSELAPVYYTNLYNGNYSFVMNVKDPASDTDKTVSFSIVKGNPMSVSNAGSIIMNASSLFLMCGILTYTELYRKRGRMDDRLFFAMILCNIVLAFADGVSYLLEGSSYPVVNGLMITGNIVFYTMCAVFPYLFLLYLDYRAYDDKGRIKKMQLPAAVPWLLLFALLLINLKTGWLFSFSDDNMYHSGSLNNLVFVPVVIYFLISLSRICKINVRLAFLGILLIVTRIALGIWFRGISSTAFTYTLFLICTHITVMNKPLNEVTP